LYRPFYPVFDRPASPLAAWGDAVQAVVHDGHVALLSAPGYMEDEQVVRTFASELRVRRIPCAMIQSPAALYWHSSGRCTLRSSGNRVAAVIRFYQAEWLCALPDGSGWKKLFQTSETPVVNTAISVLSESKRFPLAFREVPSCPTWKALMPDCRDPRDVDPTDWEHWVLKGSYSNTGDKVHICGSLSKREQDRVIREALRSPFQWIAQRRFETLPVKSCRGPLYPCIGVFVVNGRAAGAYVRLSNDQVTNVTALEAPLFIDRTSAND